MRGMISNTRRYPDWQIQYLYVTVILFLVNPLIGFLFATIQVLNCSEDYEDNRPSIILFIFSAAIWISLINITKTISGDQGVYTRFFLSVPQNGLYKTVFEAWGGSGKEPVYSFITWMLYWITGGSVRLYYFILSMSIYLPHFLAAYFVFRKINAPKGALICGILVLTFFTQYFVMTLQLVRQMLAAGLIIYALAYRATTGKNNWMLLVIAVLIHTSAFLLAALSLVPWFYSWLNLKRSLIVLGCFIPFIVFNGILGSIIGGSSGIAAIDYGLTTYSNNGYIDSAKGLQLSIMLMIFIPLSAACYMILTRYKKENNSENHDEPDYEESPENTLLPLVYICILLMIFVFSFTKSPLIQYRFFYYTYSFIPILLPLLFYKTLFEKPYWFAISLFFIVRFFITHNTSGWKYLSVTDMISSTMYYYWTGNFHWMYLL